MQHVRQYRLPASLVVSRKPGRYIIHHLPEQFRFSGRILSGDYAQPFSRERIFGLDQFEVRS
jgi:hypothetical protein